MRWWRSRVSDTAEVGHTRHLELDTRGGDIALVAEAIGVPLYAWQQHVADVTTELNPDGSFRHRVCGFTVGRQNGKTALVAARIAYELLNAGHQIAYTAQDRNLAREKWEEHVDAIMASPLAKRVDTIRRSNGSERLQMTNGARYTIVAPTKNAARGRTLDLVVVDEALSHELETIDAFLPTMATRPNGQFWVTSNAGDEGSVMLAHLRSVGHAQIADPDNVDPDARMAWLEWAPAADEFDVHDPEVWAQAIPTLAEEGRGVTRAAVLSAIETTPPDRFAREWLNVWPALEATRVLDVDKWAALERPDARLVGSVAIGVDMPRDRSRCSIVAAGIDDQNRHLIDVIDARPNVGWVHDRVVELHQRWRTPVVIDGASGAGSLIVGLEQAGVDVHAMTTRSYAQSCGLFFDAVTEGTVSHYGDRQLLDAVTAATRRNLADAWIFDRRVEADVTPLIAGVLAHWGVTAADRQAVSGVY